jgi:hypothetical protein
MKTSCKFNGSPRETVPVSVYLSGRVFLVYIPVWEETTTYLSPNERIPRRKLGSIAVSMFVPSPLTKIGCDIISVSVYMSGKVFLIYITVWKETTTYLSPNERIPCKKLGSIAVSMFVPSPLTKIGCDIN